MSPLIPRPVLREGRMSLGAGDGLAFPVGVGDFVDDYDIFLLDLWGVVHDGEGPYPGAVETLAALRDAGKPVVFLSNAPRLGEAAARSMDHMGIGRDLYASILTSGDVVNRALMDRSDPEFEVLGASCLFVGPERDWNILDGTDVRRVTEAEEATFVLCTGPVDMTETEADYLDVLDACARAGLPMVCANPDIAVVRAGEKVMCAGALAAIYKNTGCPVIYRGKPDAHIFHDAVRLLGLGDHQRVVMIGDGLHTDIPGAARAGYESVFIAGGLNASALGIVHGERPDPARVRALLAEYGLAPRAVLPALVWGESRRIS